MRWDFAIGLAVMLGLLPHVADAQRQCKKGIPCGNSCISASRTCRIGTSSGSSGTTLRPQPARLPKSDGAEARRMTTDQGWSSTRVWVNNASRVYHCPGTRYYGATARGEYVIERDAMNKGYRPASGKTCGALATEPEDPPATALPLLGDSVAPEGAYPVSAAGSTRVRLSRTSRVYFCPSAPEYDAPERGAFMTERDARAAAFQSATGHPCVFDANATKLPAAPVPLARRDPEVRSRPVAPTYGNTKVWVNTKSRVYHCPGTRYYGATVSGRYMTERDAIADGYRGAYRRTCGT